MATVEQLQNIIRSNLIIQDLDNIIMSYVKVICDIEITGNEKYFVSTEKIKSSFAVSDFSMTNVNNMLSLVEIKAKLLNKTIFSTKVKENGKTIVNWYGIKIKYIMV